MPKRSKMVMVALPFLGLLASIALQPLASLYAQWTISEPTVPRSLARLDPHHFVDYKSGEDFVGASPSVHPPIPVSPDLSDFDPPQGTIHPRLDSALSQIVQELQNGQDVKTLARWKALPEHHDQLQVIIEADGTDMNDLLSRIRALGGHVQGAYQHLVQAFVHPTLLVQMADLPGVRFVRRPMDFFPQATTSEGVARTGQYAWLKEGFRGQGAKIAIIDSGFVGYKDLLGKELPLNPIPMSFVMNPFTETIDPEIDSATDHGTAIAEILYDMAPDATYYYVTISTEVEIGKAVDWLIQEKVQVVSFSLGILAAQTDNNGIVERMVNKAHDNGIFWVSAAGNYGHGHWQGTFFNPSGDDWHEFSAGERLLALDIGPQEVGLFFLKWNDWPNSKQDFGLYLFWESVGGNLELAGFSDSVQDGSQPPSETIITLGPPRGRYYLAIKKFRTTKEDVRLEIVSLVQEIPGGIPEGSIVSPASARGAFAVGATNGFDRIQKYSSRGPTEDGRIKPDLVAPDTVTTVTYGKHGFPGTSASVPHVAGAAAALLSAYPTWKVQQIQQYLEQNALVIGNGGKNTSFGAGRLQLGAAPQVTPISTPTPAATVTPAPTEPAQATPTRTPPPAFATPTEMAWPDHNRYLPYFPR